MKLPFTGKGDAFNLLPLPNRKNRIRMYISVFQLQRKETDLMTTTHTAVPEKEPAPAPTERKSDKKYLWLCMLIPAVIMALIYFARGQYPIGDGTVLVLDLNGQYVWFFEALRNAVHGDASLLYSFSRALGGEFIGIYAYYLASPLSYLVCLFPQNMMQEALLFLFLVKTALCGGTFGYYMHKNTGADRNRLAIILFSSFYALSAYAVVQQNNIMWIDAVMWLPLITLGMESLIKYGKFRMYTAFLALTLLSNFYIGYMVCIYCFFYFFIYYFAHNENGRNNPLGEKLHFLKSLLRTGLYSVIAVGISAVLLLGAYYSLNFGKTTFSSPDWSWTLKMDIKDLLYKLLPGSYDTVRPEGLPFVYCGLPTLLFLPFYFLSKKYPIRQKVFSVLLILFFVFGFFFSVPDLIWHGFQRPNWLNYRYSFMLCFYLCVLACRAFADYERIPVRHLMTVAGFIGLFCVFLQAVSGDEKGAPNDYTCIFFTLILLFVYLAVFGASRLSRNRQVVSVTLVTVVALELFLNGLFCINALDMDVTYTRHSYYSDFLKKARPITEMVQESDPSFYRMEKTFFRKVNDNMALNIRGLSGSTSTLNRETVQFLQKMGYCSKSHSSKYLGGTPVNDSLLGLKYILSDNGIYANYYEVYLTDPETGYTAYYNPYALSIAYGVSDRLADFPLGYREGTGEKTDTGAMAGFVASLKEKLNDWLRIQESTGEEYTDLYSSPFERLNAIVTAMLGEEETVRLFVPVRVTGTSAENLRKGYYSGGEEGYTQVNSASPGILTYRTEMPVDGELFFYLPTNYPREVKLSLTKSGTTAQMGTFNGGETQRIISLGMQKAGEKLTLDMTLTGTNFYYLSDAECFYYLDMDVFRDAMARLAKDQYQITSYTEHSFDGTFTASQGNELVLTTIPYDTGWSVFVDGEKVEIQKALGALISFRVDGEAGETHTVRMSYNPPILTFGAIVSGLFLLLFLLLIPAERFCKKVPVLRSVVGIPESRTDTVPTAAPVAAEKNDAQLPPPELPASGERVAENQADAPKKEEKIRFRVPLPSDQRKDQ